MFAHLLGFNLLWYVFYHFYWKYFSQLHVVSQTLILVLFFCWNWNKKYAPFVLGYLTEFGYEKKKTKETELQDEDKEKKLSDSTKDLGELSKLFKSPEKPIIFIPMANAMSSGSTAKKKSLHT